MHYKAWGETRYASGTTATKYTFTGQYSYAGEFGLHFYNARWYDSSLSRFASADTVVPAGVQGYDRYAYVNNAPTRYTDPTGHICKDGDENIWGYCGEKLPAPNKVTKYHTAYLSAVARKYGIHLSPDDVWSYSSTQTMRLTQYDQKEDTPYGFTPHGSRTDDYYDDNDKFIETPDNTVVIFQRTFEECDDDNCVAGVLAHEATHSWLEYLIEGNTNLPRTGQLFAEEVLADNVALEISPANPIIIDKGIQQNHLSDCQAGTGTDCLNPGQILFDYYKLKEIFNVSDLVYGR